MAVAYQRRRLTIEEYHQMIETGILSEDERIELIRARYPSTPRPASRKPGWSPYPPTRSSPTATLLPPAIARCARTGEAT